MENQGKSIKNRRALAQGVSDHQKCAFDISHFHFFDFDLLGEHLQSKPTQTAISHNFSKPEPWTRIRATNRTRVILSCLSYAHARRRPWELSNTPVVANFQQGFCFLALRNVFFFSEQWCQMEPWMASKMLLHLIKTTLETKSHVKMC